MTSLKEKYAIPKKVDRNLDVFSDLYQRMKEKPTLFGIVNKEFKRIEFSIQCKECCQFFELFISYFESADAMIAKIKNTNSLCFNCKNGLSKMSEKILEKKLTVKIGYIMTFNLYYDGFEFTTTNKYTIYNALLCTEEYYLGISQQIPIPAEFDFNVYEKLDDDGSIIYEVERRIKEEIGEKISIDKSPCAICGLSINENHIDKNFIETFYHYGTYKEEYNAILNNQITSGVFVCDKCDVVLSGIGESFVCPIESLFERPKIRLLVKTIVKNPIFLRNALKDILQNVCLSKGFIERIISVLGFTRDDFGVDKRKSLKKMIDERIEEVDRSLNEEEGVDKGKLPKYCSDCNTELSFDNSSFSSQTKHTQIYLHCKKCNLNRYFCFDENMNECDKLPWEH
ncbi:MAG: hypothetical protein HZR80_16900 [Candidatus Heimdallarchaeota archaeon]